MSSGLLEKDTWGELGIEMTISGWLRLMGIRSTSWRSVEQEPSVWSEPIEGLLGERLQGRSKGF